MERGSLMLNTTTFVGLDVHARSVKAVALDVMTGETKSATFAYDAAAVAEWVGSLDPAAKCACESGVTGFDLQKKLTALGVDCVVGAVSKMIKPSADRRRKNDRNDAEFLARMLSVGNVVEDLRRCKQRLSKFLLRHGYAFSETTPTGRRKGSWMLASILFSPFSPTYFHQSRQRGCAGFANADAPLSAPRRPPPSRPRRQSTRPSGGTTDLLS